MDESENEIDEQKAAVALSRREWLLSLGSALVLSGFRGAPSQAQLESHAAITSLPAGLYRPSLDHLSHALDSKGTFLPIPPGAETEYVQPRLGPFVPQGFTPEEFSVIRRLVEIILGEDLKSSAEGSALGAPDSIYDEIAEWIDLLVASAPGTRKLARSGCLQSPLSAAKNRYVIWSRSSPNGCAATGSLGSAKNRSGVSPSVSSMWTPAANTSSFTPSATPDRIGLRLMQARACSIS